MNFKYVKRFEPMGDLFYLFRKVLLRLGRQQHGISTTLKR